MRCCLLLCSLLSLPAAADSIYRCVDADGSVRYQQSRCAEGAGELLLLGPENRGLGGVRPTEEAWLHGREADRSMQPPSRPAASRSKGASTRACWKKRHALEGINRTLRRGYKPAQGESLRHRREDIEDYLARFCS